MKNKTILNQLVKISYLEEKNEDLILSDNFLRQNRNKRLFDSFIENTLLACVSMVFCRF